jgi:hypothetical protein
LPAQMAAGATKVGFTPTDTGATGVPHREKAALGETHLHSALVLTHSLMNDKPSYRRSYGAGDHYCCALGVKVLNDKIRLNKTVGPHENLYIALESFLSIASLLGSFATGVRPTQTRFPRSLRRYHQRAFLPQPRPEGSTLIAGTGECVCSNYVTLCSVWTTAISLLSSS